jgi:hypothetical protein
VAVPLPKTRSALIPYPTLFMAEPSMHPKRSGARL